ncbi:FAD/NAD(P)-binding protein [Hyphomicrobium sp. 802]|uniref:FAD/NAD(P)-binding protein n=1 Tax=Hyphomicrobium sp. 802 TaxID=1112272 RepID=UPI00045E5C7C|nr:FAD/NAD(P)-binding protein [Hyphomicrobium sp. 802]
MSLAKARNVLILGGGASGTLLAIQILRTNTNTTITLIERTASPGKGIAYGSVDPIHLLNVRASNMSAYPDMPDHFVHWLDKNSQDARAIGGENFRFASRLAFGNYLSSELQRLSATAQRCTNIQGEAVALSRSASGIVVTLDNYRRVKGDVAVIATGYEAPTISGLPGDLIPWLSVDGASLKKVESILLLGTGLSTVDQVQSLIAAGYQGKIYAISRRGLLPHAHRPVEPAAIADADVPYGRRLSKIFHWFRTRSEQAAKTGSDWRAVLDGLRPYVQKIWQSLSLEDKARFVRHARPWWDVRRHRMAPKVAAAIDDLIARGRLIIIPAKIISVTPQDNENGSFKVFFRRRGTHAVEAIEVEGITDCTGFSVDVSRIKNPLIRSLLDQGLARPDRLGLGFDVDGAAALIDLRGDAASDIFALGPLTRGAFWEITGIPDIREQCAQLAARLTDPLDTRAVDQGTRARSG